MKKIGSRGFTAIELLLGVVVIVVLTSSSLYYVHRNNSKKYTTHSTTLVTTDQSNNQQQASTPQIKYLEIKEWGIKLKLTQNIQDAYYDNNVFTQMDAFTLRTHSLDSEKQCKEDSQAVVTIFRVKQDTLDDRIEGKTYKDTHAAQGTTIGDYFYFTEGAQYGCALTEQGRAILDKVRPELIQSGTTIEKI